MKYPSILLFISLFLFGAKSPGLQEYESLSHIDAIKFPRQHYRTFDKEGVIMQNGSYHPLTICIYGILSYDAFVKTGDSTFYDRVVNQFRYFVDSNFIFLDGNHSAGLIYRRNEFDVKAPWVSGMTQGAAVSYLLRYYELTSDIRALNLCPKLINLMLKPEQEGGTLGRTKEGLPWIEEYPNSKRHKDVMNGFINAFIGLHEYCLKFTEDTHAIEMRDSCYQSLIESTIYYDRANWTTYSRGSWDLSNSYMLYQLQEFEHLYSLFGDERLRNQMRIWSYFAINKPDTETIFLKRPDYQFGRLMYRNPFTDSVLFSDYDAFSTGLVEESPAAITDSILEFTFSSDRYYCELTISCDEPTTRNIAVTAFHNSEKIMVNCTYRTGKIIIESCNPLNKIVFSFPDKTTLKSCKPKLTAYDYKTSELSLFGIYPLKKTEVLTKGSTYCFNWRGINLTNATVLYRYAPTKADLQTQKFRNNQAFRLDGGSFVAPENGTYEFFISYDLVHPTSSISVLSLEQK
jgi:hypothetical protein